MARSSSRLTATGLVLIALLLGVLVVQPLQDEVEALSVVLTEKQTEFDALQAEIASFTELEATLPQAKSERERLLAAVPEGLNQDELVSDLDGLAQEVGIALNSISFALQPSETLGANTVGVSANFTGEYNDLQALLQALETNERLFKVESIGVQLGDVTEAGYTMTFTVALMAYYQE